MKNNKSVIVLLLVSIVGIIGSTISYFSNNQSIENSFSTKEYGTTYIEEFVSPNNWLPGDTTDKIVTVTNSGQVDEAVRISLSESWTTANNNHLNGWIHSDGTKSPHESNVELETDERVAIINFVNNNDWTKVGNYYYYNYKLEPSETTDSLIESVTFNPKIKLDNTCETSINGNTKTITCNSSGSDYDNATYKLTINIETVQYNKYKEAWNTGNSVTISNGKPLPGSEYLLENATNELDAEYNSTTKNKMFIFTHGDGVNQVTESRYIGSNPKNYVKFNCDNDGTNCENWRIIGVFDVDDGTGKIEQRIKLVKSDTYETKEFNSVNNNDWTIAPLNTYLNNDYYNGLKKSARNLIDNAKYYLGAINWDSTNSTFGNVEEIYNQERGNIVCGACNNDVNKLTWVGKVALMYPSDVYMVYGNGVNTYCYNNPQKCSQHESSSAMPNTSWIYNSSKVENSTVFATWLISSPAETSEYALTMINSYGNLNGFYSLYSYYVRPVVYLKSNVRIIGGTGHENNPYVLK